MSDFYAKEPYVQNGNYYIHRHAENIGKIKTGQQEDLFNLFTDLKGRQAAALANKRQYKFLFNTHLSDEALSLVNETFEGNEEEFITAIDEVLRTNLQAGLNEEKFNKVLDKFQGLDLNKAQLNQELNNAIEGLEKPFSELNSIIEVIYECVKILGNAGKALAVYLNNEFNFGNGINITSREDCGRKLMSAINKVRQDMDEKVLISSKGLKQVEAVVRSLNILADRLITGKTASNETLSADSLKKVFEGTVMSEGIGEALGIAIDTAAKKNIDIAISRAAKDFSLTGKDKFRISVTNPEGEYTGGQIGEEAAGKTDLKYKNVEVNLSSKFGPDFGEIKLDVGLSIKFYKDAYFTDNGFAGKKGGNVTFHTGAGLKLDRALAISLKGERLRYLAANVLAWQKEDAAAAQATNNLGDVLIRRNLVNAISSRGTNESNSDFSMFMLVNGKIVSVWEMINYVLNTDNEVTTANSPFEIRIGDNKGKIDGSSKTKISSLLTRYIKEEWNVRIKNTNAALQKANVSIGVRPTLLAKAMRGAII